MAPLAGPHAADAIQFIPVALASRADHHVQRQAGVPAEQDLLAVEVQNPGLADGGQVAPVWGLDVRLGADGEQSLAVEVVDADRGVLRDQALEGHVVMVVIVLQPEASDHECERSGVAVAASMRDGIGDGRCPPPEAGLCLVARGAGLY